jgi:adenine deaminase
MELLGGRRYANSCGGGPGRERSGPGREKRSISSMSTPGSFSRGCAVAVKGPWIAYVGPEADHTVGSATKVIDAQEMVLIPGLVDGHAHILYYAAPHEYLFRVMAGGTTTIITEIMELAFPLGYAGLCEFSGGSCRDQPIKVFSTVPSLHRLQRRCRSKRPRRWDS